MNYKKILCTFSLILISNITHAGLLNRICITTATVYIHQNIMTKQDLTKIPHITSEDIDQYLKKVTLTLDNTQKSLLPILQKFKDSLDQNNKEDK